jgi:hypothetical protein
MTIHNLVVFSSVVVAFGYGAIAVMLISLDAPVGPVLLEYILPAGVGLGGGIATARGKAWGPLLIAPPAAMLAISLVSSFAPLYAASLFAVTALALLEAALLWMRRPKGATGSAADGRAAPESANPV